MRSSLRGTVCVLEGLSLSTLLCHPPGLVLRAQLNAGVEQLSLFLLPLLSPSVAATLLSLMTTTRQPSQMPSFPVP